MKTNPVVKLIRRCSSLIGGWSPMGKNDPSPEVRALARHICMSAYKAHRVIYPICGCSYELTLLILELLPYRACYPIFQLVHSASANAHNNMGLNKAATFIKYVLSFAFYCRAYSSYGSEQNPGAHLFESMKTLNWAHLSHNYCIELLCTGAAIREFTGSPGPLAFPFFWIPKLRFWPKEIAYCVSSRIDDRSLNNSTFPEWGEGKC